MTVVLPVVDISALISFSSPMLYARHPFIRSSLNSKLLSLLIVGIFAVSRTGNVFVTASTHNTRTPSTPPYEIRASHNWVAFVTSWPSFIKLRT